MVRLSHPYMTTWKTIPLTIRTFVAKVMSLLFNTLSRFVIQLSSKELVSFNFMAVVSVCSDFGAQENKVCHCFRFFPSICCEVIHLNDKISVLPKRGSELSFLSTIWRHNEKIAICKPARGFSPELVHAGTLVLDFQSPELWDVKFLVFESHSLWHFCYSSWNNLICKIKLASFFFFPQVCIF